MKKSIGSLTVLALAGGLMVAALSPALAHGDETTTAGSSVGMAYKAKKGKFVGTVSSGKDGCVGDRKVKVYKITRTGKSPVGSATTNDAGAWRVSVGKARGKYGATATFKNVTVDSGSDQYGNLWSHVLECNPGATTIKV